MGLSSTNSEIDDDFSRKSQNVPTPVYFAPMLKEFPLELGTGASSQKTRIMGLPGLERNLTISSAVWMQCSNVTEGQTDGQTDRQIDTGRQHRSRLRMESRGNKMIFIPECCTRYDNSVRLFACQLIHA